MTGPDAREISRLLAGHIERLARELLPDGRRDGTEWVASIRAEKTPSLKIHLGAARPGMWVDFGGTDKGDALDLVATVLFRGDRKQAFAWAKSWLGLGGAARSVPTTATTEPPAESEGEDQAERRAAAQAMWLAAQPSLADTPAVDYLYNRGIDLVRLGRQPRALRFHPRLWNTESRRHWPALVAAVSDAAGAHAATHRTWLALRHGAWGKAPLADARKSFGPIRGGSIRLWRGRSRKSLADAPLDDIVAIAEGIETALSVAVACPELRVLASVAVSNMAAITLPPAIRTVVLCADNDGGNQATRAAVFAAVDRFAAEGRRVHVARPYLVGVDWNDALQERASLGRAAS